MIDIPVRPAKLLQVPVRSPFLSLIFAYSVFLKSAVGLPCVSIMTSVCPASNGEQVIASIDHQEALPEAAAAAYRAKVETYTMVGKCAAMCRYEQFWCRAGTAPVCNMEHVKVVEIARNLCTFLNNFTQHIKAAVLSLIELDGDRQSVLFILQVGF